MHVIRYFSFLFIFFILIFLSLYAHTKPVSIAITDLYNSNIGNSNITKIGKNISTVISDNLERSGLFLPLDKRSFIQSESSLSNQPRFEDWKVIQASYLFSGKIDESKNKISVEFRLFDVISQKQLIGKKYETSKKNWRRISHIIADSIFEKITGEVGYYDTRIVYVAEAGSKANLQKRLAIMDQDQANHRFLTDGSYLVASPRFSPNAQKIAYLSYLDRNNPKVFILDIAMGRQEKVGEFPNITFAPRFSPDGKKIILSYSDPEVGNSEIYTIDLNTRVTKRITNNSAIDISASFSPDSQQIVFNSDRSGRRHLYVSDADGNNTKRISREAGSYYAPIWSPRGDFIAFTKREGGQFYIGVMETDGANERMIAKAFYVDGPSWSPNGRYLMYYKTERTSVDGSGGESSLYAIDLTGDNERKVITPLGASQPDWSALMHKTSITNQFIIRINKIDPLDKPIF